MQNIYDYCVLYLSICVSYCTGNLVQRDAKCLGKYTPDETYHFFTVYIMLLKFCTTFMLVLRACHFLVVFCVSFTKWICLETAESGD